MFNKTKKTNMLYYTMQDLLMKTRVGSLYYMAPETVTGKGSLLLSLFIVSFIVVVVNNSSSSSSSIVVIYIYIYMYLFICAHTVLR